MKKELKRLLETEIDPAFAARARIIFSYIEKEKPKRILEVGCGRGFYMYSLSSYDFPTLIAGLDVSKEYISIAKRNCTDSRVKVMVGSAYTIEYPDNYFDCIICTEVLEHLDDEQKALSEMKRVLKKNGSVIITVPNHNFPILWDPLNWFLMKTFHTHINKDIWWLAGIWADHVRLYTQDQLRAVIEKSGLKIQEEKQVLHAAWPFSHFILYGIGKNIVERIGFKSFYRFNVDRSNPLVKLIAQVFAFPSAVFDKGNLTSSVNIVVWAKK